MTSPPPSFSSNTPTFWNRMSKRGRSQRKGLWSQAFERHYMRILPDDVNNPVPAEDPNSGTLNIANLPGGTLNSFPAKEIVDAGFLELVRYGIRKPDDPLIRDSLKVIDAVLKVDTPMGPVWHRYNHDGYGQREDGGAYAGWGKGRAWPLLTGERAHFELAAGRDVTPFIRALEGFASATGLLPEQVWDEQDRPEIFMALGRPTGSAMPLMWAHAEYVKLLKSVILIETLKRQRSGPGRNVFLPLPHRTERGMSYENTSCNRWF